MGIKCENIFSYLIICILNVMISNIGRFYIFYLIISKILHKLSNQISCEYWAADRTIKGCLMAPTLVCKCIISIIVIAMIAMDITHHKSKYFLFKNFTHKQYIGPRLINIFLTNPHMVLFMFYFVIQLNINIKNVSCGSFTLSH